MFLRRQGLRKKRRTPDPVVAGYLCNFPPCCANSGKVIERNKCKFNALAND